MQRDLTRGSIVWGLISFSLPLVAGNLLQQLYNIVDTWVVGRFLGNVALAAVGSAFSLMTLLTSLLLGLCMGSGVVFSQLYGAGNLERMKAALFNAFVMIALLALALTGLSYAFLPQLIALLRIPPEAVVEITAYLQVIFAGIVWVFLYNYVAAVLRSVGNSLVPLLFLLVKPGARNCAHLVRFSQCIKCKSDEISGIFLVRINNTNLITFVTIAVIFARTGENEVAPFESQFPIATLWQDVIKSRASPSQRTVGFR